MVGVMTLASFRQRLLEATDAAMAAWCGSAMIWGRDDCLMALADIYRMALGRDPGARWRDRYDSEAGAAAFLGKRGVARPIGQAARAMGWKRIAPERALPGDLGIGRSVTGMAGIIRHRRDWIGRMDFGFSAIAPRDVVAAWRVR